MPADLPDIQSQSEPARDSAVSASGVSDAEIVLRSEDLFVSKKEIVIVHNGERYRLRLTRRGKLILQK